MLIYRYLKGGEENDDVPWKVINRIFVKRQTSSLRLPDVAASCTLPTSRAFRHGRDSLPNVPRGMLEEVTAELLLLFGTDSASLLFVIIVVRRKRGGHPRTRVRIITTFELVRENGEVVLISFWLLETPSDSSNSTQPTVTIVEIVQLV